MRLRGPAWRWLVATLVLVLVVAGLSPAVRSRVKATMVSVEMLGAPVRPLSWTTLPPHHEEVALETTEADVYRARGFSSQAPLVLVHGANPGGKDDPRVIDLARSLARTGRQVVVPQLGLRHERLDPLDGDRIIEAIAHANDSGPVGVLAFSYGAALALVSLGDRPTVQDEVAFVATVGTYFDLRNVVRGITTGTVPYRGRNIPWEEADPRAPDILATQLAEHLGAEDGRALRRAWETRDPEGLSNDALPVFELLVNHDPAMFPELFDRLPPPLSTLAEELSPSRVVDRIRVPVLALHAHDDPASPPSESRLLIDSLDAQVRTELVEVGNLRHVTPTASFMANLREGISVAGFAALVLRAQEGWPRL